MTSVSAGHADPVMLVTRVSFVGVLETKSDRDTIMSQFSDRLLLVYAL